METKITPVWMKIVIISLASIVYGLILYFADLSLNEGLNYVNYLILCAGVIYFCIQYAKQHNANVSFGNVFGHGFKISAGVAALIIVWSIIAMTFVFPDLKEKIIEQTGVKMAEQNSNMSSEDREKGLAMMRRFFIPGMIVGILFMYAIVGAIASLIGAAVAKKNPNPNPL